MLNNYPLSLLIISVVMEVCGILAMILIAVSLHNIQGPLNTIRPFEYSDAVQRFAFHPLFMFIGMIFLLVNAAVFFRVFRTCSKLGVKIAHAIVHIIGWMFMVTAAEAAFSVRNLTLSRHMFSMHSWLGMIVMVLFSAQWVASLILFFVPVISDDVKATFMPVHRWIGNCLVVLCFGAILSGQNGYLHTRTEYAQRPSDAIMFNVGGLFAFFFVALAFFILQRPAYRRPSEIEYDA